MHSSTTAEIVVIGAGPAGIAAAVASAESGKTTLVVDDNFSPGGQIWRSGVKHPPSQASALVETSRRHADNNNHRRSRHASAGARPFGC